MAPAEHPGPGDAAGGARALGEPDAVGPGGTHGTDGTHSTGGPHGTDGTGSTAGAAVDRLDAGALRRWVAAAVEDLAAAREEVDALNVYPVPDGDTGTNLLLTLQSVAEALAAAPPELGPTVAAVTRGALLGARGNSGVIVSQLLRGLAEAVGAADGGQDGGQDDGQGTRQDDGAGPPAEVLRRGLLDGDALARAAVAAPVEGTVLSVARAAAEGCTGADLAEAVRRARRAADAALARTPEQLDVLRQAGVVDAGGRGWCVLLRALERTVTGAAAPAVPGPVVVRDPSAPAARESGSEDYAYEVQFLLEGAADEAVATLREQLGALGDSLVVVGGAGLFNVHVHVNDVGAVLEAGVAAGRPSRITVTRFADQVAELAVPVMNERPAQRAVVAVAPGPGLAALLRAGGAAVVDGGPSANPSTAEVLEAVRATGAREVLLLPDDGNVLAVARAVAGAAPPGVEVRVVPTRSVVQGLAALAVSDPSLPLEEAVAGMAAAAAAVRSGEVTRAVRDASTAAGPCRAGDALGLVDGAVVEVGPDLGQVAEAVLRRLLEAQPELVTLLTGQGAPDGLAERLAGLAAAVGAEVEVHDGGQPHYPLLLGAE